MKQIAEKVKAKNPQETQVESAVQELSVAFYELKDWVQTVVDKMNLDAQDDAEEESDESDRGIDILGDIGEILTGVFKALVEDDHPEPPTKVSAKSRWSKRLPKR